MASRKELIQGYEADIEALQGQLAPLEAGTLHVGGCHAGGLWVDMTPEHIEILRNSIGSLEASMARCQKERDV